MDTRTFGFLWCLLHASAAVLAAMAVAGHAGSFYYHWRQFKGS